MAKKKARGRRRAAVAPEVVNLEDEVEAFGRERETVMLDEDEGEAFEEESEGEVPVMDLEGETDESDEDVVDEEEEDEAWRKKGLFYGGDNVDFNILSSDEEEALQEEEEEARRLQGKELEELEDADFEVGAGGPGEEEGVAQGAAAKEAADDEPEASVMDSVRAALGEDSDDGDDIDGAVEVLSSEEKGGPRSVLSSLSEAERLRIVQDKSPELVLLLEDLGACAEKLRRHRADSTRESERLLRHALINYGVNILFYLKYKADGGDVRSHPVVDHLLQMKKLVRRLESLAAFVTDSDLEPLSPDADAEAAPAATEAQEPNGGKMATDPEDVADEDAVEERDATDEVAESDPDEGSELADDVDDESDGLAAEEQAFLSLAGRAPKPSRRHSGTGPRYGDVKVAAATEEGGTGRSRVMRRIRMPEGLAKADRTAPPGRRAAAPTAGAAEEAAADEDDDGDDDDDDDDAYGLAEEQKRKRQEEKLARRSAAAAVPKPHVYTFNDGLGDTERRKASREVIKNRGLTPYRSKKRKNPRLRHRHSYEDKVKRSRGAVREADTRRGGVYIGETSGVNLRASRGTKL